MSPNKHTCIKPVPSHQRKDNSGHDTHLFISSITNEKTERENLFSPEELKWPSENIKQPLCKCTCRLQVCVLYG